MYFRKSLKKSGYKVKQFFVLRLICTENFYISWPYAYFLSISFGLQTSLSKGANIFGNLIKVLRYFWFRLRGHQVSHLTKVLSTIGQFQAARTAITARDHATS